MKKKLWSLLLALFMLICIVPVGTFTAFAVDGFEGAGTAENPYRIASAADWDKFCALVDGGNTLAGAYFQLTNDIKVSRQAGKSDNPWNNRKAFSGVFEGGGHIIELDMKRDESELGLFHCIENGAYRSEASRLS